MKTSHAVVVLPPTDRESIGSEAVMRWLARGRPSRAIAGQALVERVAGILGSRIPAGSQAALRYLGQHRSPPRGWIAAADPVTYTAHLTRLSVQPISPGSVESVEFQAIFDTLQAELGVRHGVEFSCRDSYGYLASGEPFETEARSPEQSAGMLDGRNPAGDRLTRLRGEIEMLLHEHDVNRRREARGAPPVNGLWIWGGGSMPAATAADLPLLCGDDPLFAGTWQASGGPTRAWPGSLADCLAAVVVVVVCPAEMDAAICLGALRELISARRLDAVTVVFREGATVVLRSFDRFRFWRRTPIELPGGAHDD